MLKRNLASLSLAALLAVSPAVADAARLVPVESASVVTTGRVAAVRTVKLFLVALDDGGRHGKKIGCNDSLVSITRKVSATGAPLRAALEELLRLPQKGGPRQSLHNALYGSELKLERVSIRRGEALIQLSGSLVIGGVCDGPRVQGQIEATARQFPGVRRVKVYVNGKPLAEHLSERG